jgi:DnaJ-class molecular chaperone
MLEEAGREISAPKQCHWCWGSGEMSWEEGGKLVREYCTGCNGTGVYRRNDDEYEDDPNDGCYIEG